MAKHFDVSRRTVFRDIRDIQEMNVPMEYSPLEGHKLMPGYSIPPLMFTEKELSVIAVALSFLNSQNNIGMAKDAEEVAAKIYGALRPELKEYLQQMQKAVIVDPYLSLNQLKNHDPGWFSLADAIIRKIVISFVYRQSKQRLVSPYLIVFFQDHWNLIAYDHHRKALRNFYLEYISDIELSGATPYKPHEENQPIELILGKDNANSKTVVVSVKNESIPTFLSSVPNRAVKIEETKKQTRYQFSFDNLEYLAKWLLRFGNDLQVIEPFALKKAIKKELMAAISSYKNID